MALKSLKVLKRIGFITTSKELYDKQVNYDSSDMGRLERSINNSLGKEEEKPKRVQFYFAHKLIVDFINANKISKEDILSIKEYDKSCVLYFYEEIQIKRPERIEHPDQFISNKF